MKTFETSKRKSNEAFANNVPVEFSIDGDVFTAFPPTEGQVAFLMASQSSESSPSDSLAGILDFFEGILDEDSYTLLKSRLKDREDNLTFQVLHDVLEALIEEWTELPTQPPSASSRSRRSTGAKSTAKQSSKG